MRTIFRACLLWLCLCALPSPTWAQAVQSRAQAPQSSGVLLMIDAIKARQRVIAIVNQPITHLPRSASLAAYSEGWFHPGALKPDFNTVDIRTSQQLLYSGRLYVTSNLNPSEMFLGDELEFNGMTKMFYVDRNLPKKKLTEDEMLEINRLYRIMGRAETTSIDLHSDIVLPVLAFLFVVMIVFPAMLILTRKRPSIET